MHKLRLLSFFHFLLFMGLVFLFCSTLSAQSPDTAKDVSPEPTSTVLIEGGEANPEATSPEENSVPGLSSTENQAGSSTEELKNQLVPATTADSSAKPFYMDQRFWILAADVVIILFLLLTLTIRILSKFASPSFAVPNSPSPQKIKAKRKSGKPLTVDELNIDIPV